MTIKERSRKGENVLNFFLKNTVKILSFTKQLNTFGTMFQFEITITAIHSNLFM